MITGNPFGRVTLPLAAVNFLNQASRAVLAVIGPALALEFGMSASDLGLLAAVLFMAYAATQLPAGLALDVYGARRVQAVLALTAGGGFLLCALAEGPAGLMLGRVLTGIGIAAGLTAMLKANTQWYPRHRVAAITGTGLLIGAMGGMSVTLPLSSLLPLIGWRGGFALLAGLAVVISLWIWLSVPDRPPGEAPAARRSLAAHARAFGPIFAHPAFVGFVPAICLLSGMNFTYQGLWAGPWLRDVAGQGDAARATVLFAYACGMALGSWGTGQLASRGQARGLPPLLVPFCFMGLQLGFQAMFAFAPPSGVPALCVAWACFAICGASGPTAYAALGQRFPPELAGRVATAINAAMLCTVFALQTLIGAVLDLWPRTGAGGWDPRGYTAALMLTMGAQILALLWAWRAARRMPASA